MSLQPGCSRCTFVGHTASVMSVDVHPNKDDVVCSCDLDGEIRYWSINNGSCARVFKVESTEVELVRVVMVLRISTLLNSIILICLNALGWRHSGEIPTSSWKISCCSGRECCIYSGCGDTSLSAFITGLLNIMFRH